MKYDSTGMVPDMTMKKIFASIHFDDDKDLFNNFSSFYTTVTGGLDLRFADFQKIFGKPQLLKTLFVSAETLRSPQEGVCNGLALAFNVWLEDTETLYSNRAFSESDQKEIIFKYLAVLYDAMEP